MRRVKVKQEKQKKTKKEIYFIYLFIYILHSEKKVKKSFVDIAGRSSAMGFLVGFSKKCGQEAKLSLG